jgi:hypothetical protein
LAEGLLDQLPASIPQICLDELAATLDMLLVPSLQLASVGCRGDSYNNYAQASQRITKQLPLWPGDKPQEEPAAYLSAEEMPIAWAADEPGTGCPGQPLYLPSISLKPFSQFLPVFLT